MNLRHQKIISAVLIAIVAFGGLEILALIVNLNQITLFLQAAFAIYLYLALNITLLYDLHFKNPGSMGRARKKHELVPRKLTRTVLVFFSAFADRVSHLLKKHHWLQFQNYLILPGMLFWSTVAFLYLNLGNNTVQQVFILLSGVSLVLLHWYLKETFIRKTEVVERDIFAVMSAVKIYTAAITFAVLMALFRSFCLESWLFVSAVFSLTFLLVYQALFQHKLVNIKNTGWALLISAIQGAAGFFVYRFWGYNFYTAAIFMAAVYNLLWGTFHYHLDKALTKKVFVEILLFCLLFASMVFSVTNFKARLLDACF